MVEYAYAVGRIRSLEALMLSETHLTRMVDAKDFESSFMVLRETCYAEKIDSLSSAFDHIELLKNELAFIKQFLLSMAKDEAEIIGLLVEKLENPLIDEQDYLKRLKDLARKFPCPIFSEYAKAFIEGYLASKSFHVLEKEIDNKLIEIAKKAKYKAFGFEPLFGFLIGKEMEMKNLKLILTGKLLKAGTNEIKSRMRKSYA